MSITVLLATYNRCELLADCLAQLAGQAFEADDEVIVVDNGSSDRTAAVVAAAACAFPVPLRYLVARTPGKSHALSAGVAAAHGDILALTDDDVLVGDDWVETVRALWREADLGLAGGRVTPRWSRPAPRWLRPDDVRGYGRLAAPLALLDYGPVRAPLGSRTALGANMAVHRRALDAAGGFPLDLGKLRGTLLSGEDHQVCERIQACGFTAVYDPRLVVRHYVPPDRLRFTYHLRWFFWSGITNAALERSGAVPRRGRVPGARYWTARTIKGIGRALAGLIRARRDLAANALVDAAFALGYLAFSTGWIRPATTPAQTGARLEAA